MRVPSKKAKKISPQVLLFITITTVVVFMIIRVLVWPLVSIFFSGNSILQRQDEQAFEIPQEEYENLISSIENWTQSTYDYFSLRAPNIERISLEEENGYQQAFLITDPQTDKSVRLLFSRRETNANSILDLLPDPDNLTDAYGITRLGKYDALRIGPDAPPYDTVNYKIVNDGYLYEISAIFSAPVSFVDQVLSTFRLTDDDSLEAKSCVVAGCNSNICIDAELFETYPFYTTCEAREDAVCYQEYGNCGITDSGECGWIENKDFNSCMAEFSDTR